jgi:antitoxin component YwqK of YwqJK toxin-antitoxin module
MTFYFPSGKKEIDGQVVNGDRDGVWYYFNADGTIQLQVLYARGVMVKERKENGTFKEYYDDEQLKSEITYVKGKREGKFTEYYDNGQWLMKPVPADPNLGTPADVQRVLEGQTKKREGTYVNDLLEGEVKEYDEKGKLVKVTRYVGGVEQ